MNWTFQHPTRVVYGVGRLGELAAHVDGARVLLLTSPGFVRRGVADRAAKLLGPRLAGIVGDIQAMPDIDGMEELRARAAAFDPDAVLALGGGSVIDSAKVLALALAAPASWSARGQCQAGAPWPDEAPLPLAAVATTAGTGAEVTPFAVLWDKNDGRKYSLSNDRLYPKTAIADPELTYSLPEEITVATGLDALAQALDSLWNHNATPVTESLALEAARRTLETLPALADGSGSGDGPFLRDRMMGASLLAGLAISHTRTAMAHSMSYPLTGRYGLPHGLACAVALPAIARFTAAHSGRVEWMAGRLGFGSAEDFAVMLGNWLEGLQLRDRVRAYVPGLAAALALADGMIAPGRADNHAAPFAPADVRAVLAASRSSFE